MKMTSDIGITFIIINNIDTILQQTCSVCKPSVMIHIIFVIYTSIATIYNLPTGTNARVKVIGLEYLVVGPDPQVLVHVPDVFLLIWQTLRLEPRNTDHTNHTSHDDGPDPKKSKLCGCVAFVDCAVLGSLLSLRLGPGGRQLVSLDHIFQLIFCF